MKGPGGWDGEGDRDRTGRDKRTGKGRVQRSREQLSIKDGNVSATPLCSGGGRGRGNDSRQQLLVGSSLHTHALLSLSDCAVLPLVVTDQSSTAEVNEIFFFSLRLTADKLLTLDTVRMKSRPACSPGN